jgi:hypothetical protein
MVGITSLSSSTMNDSSRILVVNIATVILESLLYGIFLVCFFVNLYVRVSKYANPKQFRTRAWWNPVVISTMAIFLTYSGVGIHLTRCERHTYLEMK